MNRENLKSSEEYWIGKLPIDWQEIYARRVFSQARLPKQEFDEQLTASQKFGVIPQKLFMEKQGHKVALATKGTDGFKHVDKGDFVISLRSFQGGIEICHYSGCVSPAYVILKLNKGDHRFFQYLLKCDAFIARFQSLTDGLRDGKMVSYDQFGGIKLPFPCFYEQRQIAAYLYRETANLDKLIAKQQKLIKLLQEKRQAVISKAVTKGLDPNEKMKHSGVEWLGEVPESWKVGQLGQYSNLFSGTTPSRDKAEYWSEGNIPWVKTGEIRYTEITETEEYVTPAALRETSLKIAPKGALMMAMYGQGVTRGRVALLGVPAVFNQACVAIICKREISNEFLLYYLMAAYHAVRDGGNETSQMNLNAEVISKIKVAIPNVQQQEEIVSYLKRILSNYDELVLKAKKSVELLREHRQALITASVTGKIDIRGLVTDEEVAALDADPVLETTEEDFESEVAEADYITEEE